MCDGCVLCGVWRVMFVVCGVCMCVWCGVFFVWYVCEVGIVCLVGLCVWCVCNVRVCV